MGPGTTAYLDGPHGNLTLKGRSGKGIALIAGGVGVVPLLSIARQLDKDGDPRPLILLYGNRLADQIVYEDELKLLAGKNNRDVRLVLSEPEPGWTGLRGMIDRTTLDDVFGFDDGFAVALSGVWCARHARCCRECAHRAWRTGQPDSV